MQEATGWSDEEVMRRVRQGEVSLVAVLFDRHHRKLFRFCWRMTGDSGLSEDLVQEVFLKILRHRDTFGAGCAFAVWMYTIARNAIHDAWRKRRRELPLDGEFPEPGRTDAAERDQENRLLQQAMRRLPEDKREVLIMSRYLNMSHAEIAAVLGCGEGTSRARLFRAMQSLKEIFEESIARKR